MRSIYDLFKGTETVKNTPESFNKEESEGVDNPPVTIPEPINYQPVSDGLQVDVSDLTNNPEYQRIVDEMRNGGNFTDIMSSRLYGMPTEEEERRIASKNKARSNIASVADAFRILGQGASASGGGVINLDRGNLSDANNVRYQRYKQEHDAKLAKNNQMLVDAGIADLKTQINYRNQLLNLLKSAYSEKIRFGIKDKELATKIKTEENKLKFEEKKFKEGLKSKERQTESTNRSRERIQMGRNAVSLQNAQTKKVSSGTDKTRRMIFDEDTVVFPSADSLDDINRHFFAKYVNWDEYKNKYGLNDKDYKNIPIESVRKIVQKLINENPEIKDEYLDYAKREGYDINNFSHIPKDTDTGSLIDKWGGREVKISNYKNAPFAVSK